MQNYEKLFDANGVYAINDSLILRCATSDDREAFLDIYRAKPMWKEFFANPELDPGKGLWDSFFLSDNLNVLVIRRCDDKLCGFCGLQFSESQVKPELSIELMEEYQRQGIGYVALSLLMSHYASITGKNEFISKVTYDNVASQKLMRKLGGRPAGVEPFPGIADAVRELMEADETPLDEHVIELADEFGVSTKTMRSHVLVFGFHIDG